MLNLQSCQQTEPNTHYFSNRSTGDASVLLVDDEDPTGLESDAESAFMLDNRGMIYFFVLDLSDEQKAAIKEIHQKYRPDFRAHHGAWDRSNTSWEEIKAERDSIHALIYDEIIKLLTEDQIILLDEINSQLENGEYPAAIVEYRVAKLDEKLDLSEDQQNLIAELLAEYGAKILAARNRSENKNFSVDTLTK